MITIAPLQVASKSTHIANSKDSAKQVGEAIEKAVSAFFTANPAAVACRVGTLFNRNTATFYVSDTALDADAVKKDAQAGGSSIGEAFSGAADKG